MSNKDATTILRDWIDQENSAYETLAANDGFLAGLNSLVSSAASYAQLLSLFATPAFQPLAAETIPTVTVTGAASESEELVAWATDTAEDTPAVIVSVATTAGLSTAEVGFVVAAVVIVVSIVLALLTEDSSDPTPVIEEQLEAIAAYVVDTYWSQWQTTIFGPFTENGSQSSLSSVLDQISSEGGGPNGYDVQK